MTNLKDQTYKNLRYRIITQDLAPGHVLKEKQIMQYYKIGRTPMRDIFQQLKNDGLVQIIPQSGTLVAPLDFREFRQIIEVRTALEGLAGTLAAKNITNKQLASLRQIIQTVDDALMTEQDNADLYFQCESEFHELVYAATANAKLIGILQNLQSVCARFWHYLNFGEKEILLQIDDQRQILKALEDKEPEQTTLIMENHIIKFSNQVKENILGL